MMDTVLDVIKTLSQVIAAIVIPLVVVWIGNKYTWGTRESEGNPQVFAVRTRKWPIAAIYMNP